MPRGYVSWKTLQNLSITTLTTSGAITCGGDLTVQGNFTEELDESLLGDLTLGTATQAGGDITVYKDGSGNKAFFLDASAGQLQLPTTGSGGGILIGGDTQWYRSAANVLRTPDVVVTEDQFQSYPSDAADTAYLASVLGESPARFRIRADGKLEWGPGNAARDIELYRSAANTLSLGSGDSFGATTFSDAITISHGTPRVYLTDTDETSPAGKFAMESQNDYWNLLGRKSDDSGWIPIIVAERIEDGGLVEFKGASGIKLTGKLNMNSQDINDVGNYLYGVDGAALRIRPERTSSATGQDLILQTYDVDATSWIDVLTVKGEPTGTGVDPYVLLGGNLDMSSGSYDILIPDNQATALEIKEGTNAYITFNSTDGSERVTINKNMTAALNLTVSSSFYLDGQALWGLQADDNSLTIKGRTASAAQTDTIVIQTSNASHGVNFSDRIQIGGGAATVDIDILNANLDLGGNLLKTTTYYLNEVTGGFGIQKISDDSYVTLKTGDLNIQNAENAIKFEKNAAKIKATNTDGYYVTIWARDTGVGLVEVARFAGDTDPFFSMGGSQEFKFTNGGLMGLFGATPVVQQTHIADADGTLADITTKFNSLLDKLEAYGLLATS